MLRTIIISLSAGVTFGVSVAETHPEEPQAATQDQQREPGQPNQEDEQERDPSPSYSETVVVTASKVETEIINAPAAVSVVTSETIENSGATNYGDLIRSVPGVNVSQTSARDINVSSRGATSTLSTSQLALLDGRSLYQDFFGFVAWDFLPIDPSEIAQIEVINGPASAVWGANAMTGVVNVISKTPRQLDGTTVTLGFGAVNRDVVGSDLGTGTSYRVNVTHAQAVNDRWAYKFSGGVSGVDAFARPTGTVPVDPDRGTGGGTYPPFQNKGTTQPKIDIRVDYDHPDGRQKLVFGGGYAGTEGIIHTGIGPFDIQSGTALGYAKVNYTRDNWKVNFFANILDGDAPALLAIGSDGQPINFAFNNNTYDVDAGNTQLIGTRHILTYGGNVRFQAFDLSIAPLGDNRSEGGAYIQDEIFLSDHFRWLIGGRIDKFSVLDRAVFSPRTTFMIKPRADQTFRVSFNRAYRAPSLVNNFLDVTFVQAVALPGVGQYVFPVVATGNDGLKEESLTAYEIGYTGVVGRHTASAAFYVNKTSDSIFFTPSGAYSSQNPPPGWPLPPQVLDALAQQGILLPSNFTYLNFEGVTDKGIELGLNTELTSEIRLLVNYSWQAEPVPMKEEDFSELNIPPSNRFNAGINYDNGQLFGNLNVNFTDSAFWTDVLDARFHGETERFTMVNGSFGIRFLEQKVTAAVKFQNLGNADAQQHIFGDIIKRQIMGELKFGF